MLLCSLIKEGYDVQKLQSDIDNLIQIEFIKHFGAKDSWSGIPLRSYKGLTTFHGISLGYNFDRIDGKLKPAIDTIYMEKTPYIKQILDEIPAEIHLVRVLKIKAHGLLPKHIDGKYFNYKSGTTCRIHLPIYTNSDIKFSFDQNEYYLESGKLYYVDVSQRHHVINNSDQDRIHVVIDVSTTPELIKLIEDGQIN